MSEWGVPSEVPSPTQTKVSLHPAVTRVKWQKQADFFLEALWPQPLSDCFFFCSPSVAKNIFRVRSQDPGQAQSHTLQVNDVFHKQQWLNCLRSAISVHRPLTEPPSPSARDTHCKRRPSSVSAITHMEESDENQPQQTSQSAPASPCSSATPSPSATATTPTSPSPALFSPASHKTKKDKKSLYSLGKRKETMV